MSEEFWKRMETRCAHAGAASAQDEGTNRPFQAPIAQSSLFPLGTSAEAEAIFSGERPGFAYTRFGNPTVALLAETIAAMEGGAGGLATSSGNAATLCAVTAAMEGRRGPLVTPLDLYGGSVELFQILASSFGFAVKAVDASSPAQWRAAVARAGAVMLETPSNPLMRLIDVRATVEAAASGSAPVIVDNTVATPFNQTPFEFGADWVVHSTTKYLNGHSDMVGGCAVKRLPLTPRDRSIHKNLGGTVNAFDAWLVLRGIRSFALRMAAHNRNGLIVAQWLRARPEISRVHYAGFGEGESAAIFQRQMRHGGALLSFELRGGAEAAIRFIDRLRLVVHAVIVGGMVSLATRPAMSSHRGMSQQERMEAGVSDGLIRLSVGVEAVEDILADLEQALA